MSLPERSNVSDAGGSRPLVHALVTLAGTPDDLPGVDDQVELIARLAADRVAVVAYASITALRGERYTTVAASSELALAVDEAQYGDGAGPCVQALGDAAPVSVPDIAATMRWPGFRDKAVELGLRASVSLPLFGASGATIAVLNMYGRDQLAIAPLIAGIWAVYDPAKPMPDGTAGLPAPDPGAAELIAGFAEALAVRASIQLALGVIMSSQQCSAADAYVVLRLRAAASGIDLAAAAADLIRQSA